MKSSFNSFTSWVKKYWPFFFLCLVILILLFILLFAGEQIQKGTWPHLFISALLGTATVAVITYLLLKGQARNENEVQQNKKVFENRLNAYESFLSTLKNVVINNAVDEKSEKLLQFGVATIGMHTDSTDMLKLSKNLKYILQKIKVQERADSSIWNELMEIVNIFHRSLYADDYREMDSNMRKALRNFRGLCVEKEFEVLEFIECLLSSYDFDSFIAGKCLFYNIHTLQSVRKEKEIPVNIYVTLRIDKTNDDQTYSGIIALYSKDDKYSSLQKMMNDPSLWIAPDFITLNEKEGLELGVNYIKKAYVLPFENKKKMALQSALSDIFRFMYPVWAEDGVLYFGKDKNGHISRKVPGENTIKDSDNGNKS